MVNKNIKQKVLNIVSKLALSLAMGVFFVGGVMLAVHAGSLQPSASNGLSNGSPIASMLSLLDMAQTTSGTFDRTTDSLEAISNKIDLINPSDIRFKVYKSVNQTGLIANDYNVVTLDVKYYDLGNNFANNSFVAPVTGIYSFDAGTYISELTVGNMSTLLIRKNSVPLSGSLDWNVDTTIDQRIISLEYYLVAGDSVDLVYKATTAPTIQSNRVYTYFIGNLVRAL